MASPPRVPIGRLAPSPSGRLHLGHARTFVLAWAHVRSRGGRLRLRLEDLDTSRCRPELADGVLADLSWLGIDWDGPVLRQSDNLEMLRAAAAQLAREGCAYRCHCTRADLRQAISAPQRGVEELRYPGTCRGRAELPPSAESSVPSALRFKVPEGPVAFHDGIAGAGSIDVAAEVGDFIIENRARVPSYQLAVVIDDAREGINEVFRGDDLLASVPRQLLIMRALRLPEPAWFHVPLVLDESGRRLAKRADDLSLQALRELGTDPRAILGWIAAESGFRLDPRVSPGELVVAFDLDRLRRDPVIITQEVLSELRSARDA